MSKKAKPTVSTAEPWKAIQPYLTGDASKGITGVMPEAQRLYEGGGFTPQMQGIADLYTQGVMDRSQDPRMQGAMGANFSLANQANDTASGAMPFLNKAAMGVANGAFDSNFGPVANIGQRDVGLQQARAGQGPLDPTQSLSGLLSGNVTNPYLQQQAAAMTANLTRNLNENVMPGIRSEALASGQYGGSRQGIAEGLAASRLNQDLAPALTNMFGGAFENAQNRMFGTASQLNDQAFQNATNNANRQVGVDQFNANLGLQNNSQLMQKNQANLGNRMQGLNIAQGGLNLLSGAQGMNNNALNSMQGVNSMQDSNFNNAMNALQMPQQYNWQNFQNFSNPALSAAGMGGTQSQTNYKNPAMGALGGAATGAAVGGPWGAAIGGGLGLLGGMF